MKAKKPEYLSTTNYRGVEQSGQLAWLITTRSEVQILSPQPRKTFVIRRAFFLACYTKHMNAEIAGFIAGILVAAALVPQVIKSWKTKSTNDISLGWNITSLAGQIMWIVYGFMITSYSLVIMSSITLSMAVLLFYLKLKYGM